MKNSTQPSIQPNKPIVDAIRTNEGFIEITSLELLDEMVGGLISPDAMLCQLYEEQTYSKQLATNGS